MGMCLVLECMIGFFEIMMALLLSHRMEMGRVHVISMSCKVCIIQSSCVQQDAVATYFASVVDNEIELCFLFVKHTWTTKTV